MHASGGAPAQGLSRPAVRDPRRVPDAVVAGTVRLPGPAVAGAGVPAVAVDGGVGVLGPRAAAPAAADVGRRRGGRAADGGHARPVAAGHHAADRHGNGDLMSNAVRIDVELAKRKMSVGEFADRVGLTPANVAVLKNGRAKAVRFSTLDAMCEVLECQPGDLLEWVEDRQ